MSYHFGNIAETVTGLGFTAESEILAKRASDWGKGKVTRSDAETVFAIHRKITAPNDEWTSFFVATISDYVLRGTKPKGECSESEAMWLMAQIECDARLETMAEMELLLNIIEQSRNTPHALKRYALDKIEMTVLTDIGPTRRTGILADTHVETQECELIRRIVFADGEQSEHSPGVVGYHEAETIFRLKDATLGRGNCADWPPLFVNAMANYLQQIAEGECTDMANFSISAEDTFGSNHSNFARFVRRIGDDVPAIGEAIGAGAADGEVADQPYDTLEQEVVALFQDAA